MDVLERFGCPDARSVQGIDGLLVRELQRWTVEELAGDGAALAAARDVGRVVTAWHAWCDTTDFTGLGGGRAAVEDGLLAGMSGVFLRLTDLRRAHELRAELAELRDAAPGRVW